MRLNKLPRAGIAVQHASQPARILEGCLPFQGPKGLPSHFHFPLEEIQKERYLYIKPGYDPGHVFTEHLEALGTRYDDLFNPCILEGSVIQPAEGFEILNISRPEQIVPAAPLIRQEERLNVQEVQEPDAVSRDGKRIHINSGKENIEIGSASGKKRDVAGFGYLNARIKPVETVLPEARGGHHPHPGMDGSVVGTITLQSLCFGEQCTHFQDETVEINVRRAAFTANTAGQTFPDCIFNIGFVLPLDNHFVRQKPGGVLFA